MMTTRAGLQSLFLALGATLFAVPAFAERHDVNEFSGIDWSFIPDSGCTIQDRWVEVTWTQEVGTVSDGSESTLQDFCTIDHCDEHCPCEEGCTPPSDATYSCGGSLTFTKQKSYAVTGGIEGSAGWLVAEMKAKLEGSVGWQASFSGTFSRSVSATLHYCNWQKYRTYLKVTLGTKVATSATLQPPFRTSPFHYLRISGGGPAGDSACGGR
jgi:hypothetical protein